MKSFPIEKEIHGIDVGVHPSDLANGSQDTYVNKKFMIIVALAKQGK